MELLSFDCKPAVKAGQCHEKLSAGTGPVPPEVGSAGLEGPLIAR